MLKRLCYKLFKKRASYSGNRVEIVARDGSRKPLRSYPGLRLLCEGEGNLVEIAEGISFDDTEIKLFGRGNHLVIEPTRYFIHKLKIDTWGSERVQIRIGSDFQCSGANIYITTNDASLSIGRDCMFSWDVYLWMGYSHALIDCQKARAIEQEAKSVSIGDHVWLGHGVTLSKNVTIASNCVVGTRAVVAQSFVEEGCVIAGNPARVIRRDTSWLRPMSEWVNAIIDGDVTEQRLGFWRNLVRDKHQMEVEAFIQSLAKLKDGQ